MILTDAVRDYNVELSDSEGRKKWRVHNALKKGEKVILLRCDGGQEYVVLDRWEARE